MRILLLVLVVGLIACVPEPPTLPPNFRSKVFVKSPNGKGDGVVYYQDRIQKYSINMMVFFPVVDPLGLQYYEDVGEGIEITFISGQCRNGTFSVKGLFGWLEKATFVRKTHRNLLPCELFELNNTETQTSLQMCLNGNIPVIFESFDHGNLTTQLVFYHFQVGNYEVYLFPTCSLPKNVCLPQQPEWQAYDMLRIHPKGYYGLENENTADITGDTLFICNSVLTHSYPTFEHLSIFKVNISTAFGQYGLCNNQKCMGGQVPLVGREVSYGLGPWGGQCSNGSEYGYWYSLPAEGNCSSSGNCTWNLISIPKTISLECLMGLGLEKACEKLSGGDINAAVSVVKSGLYQDENNGGCPNIFNTSQPAPYTPPQHKPFINLL